MCEAISRHELYYYVSTRAACDPVRTIYLCAPEQEAATRESARAFAAASGWQAIAEEQGAVLVVPVAAHGWAAEPVDLLKQLYGETKNRFATRSGQAIWGRTGSLWCWETVLYVVGYQEGAVFAGNFTCAHPNFAAATALVGGLPDHFSAGNAPSSHWMVAHPSSDYSVRNKDIPVCLWLFDRQPEDALPTLAHFHGMTRLINDRFANEAERSHYIFNEQFAHVIRWKNGPDGTLTAVESKDEFYKNPRHIRRTVTVADTEYEYFVHLPAGKTAEEVKGLPVVFTIHGRGEPAWMFTAKNGWDALADEIGGFVLVCPDSPGNIWFILRDGDIFAQIITQLEREYGIDTERVYLAGFSNGAVMTREMAWYRPDLFAAVSPSNGPWFDTRSMQLIDASKAPQELAPEVTAMIDRFTAEGWQMPCAIFYGDNDPTSSRAKDTAPGIFLAANGCGNRPADILDGASFFTPERGYQQGDRFVTEVYRTPDGNARVLITTMKNMPHGAIAEESRFIWEFVKQFRRIKGAKQVEQTGASVL